MDPFEGRALLEGLLGSKAMVRKSTLFSLFDAIQDEVAPEDALVVAVVSHMLRAGKIGVAFLRVEGEDDSNAGAMET